VTWVALLLCLAIAALGGVGVAAPARLFAMIRAFQSPGGLGLVAAIRIALGGVLVLAAPGARAPDLLHWLGLFVVVVGIATPFFGVERYGRVLDWWTSRGDAFVRAWSLVAVAFGLALAWAVLPG